MSKNNGSIVQIIKNIINNGIHVDKNLRVQSSYKTINLFEIENEVFASISDLLHSRSV